MTLRDSVDLWEIATGKAGTTYLEDCHIPESVSKVHLWDYLMFEFMDLRVVDSNSQFFHERVKNFFEVHYFNIDELLKTLEYEYDPLDNSRWRQNEISDDHYTRDRDDNCDRKYQENGKSNETNVNYVSAYNDNTSPDPLGNLNDSEHDRQVRTRSYDLSGEETKKEQEDITDDRHKTKDTVWNGNDGQSYQSLIEEQRKAVQFNIYKWIAKHFCKELLIAVW